MSPKPFVPKRPSEVPEPPETCTFCGVEIPDEAMGDETLVEAMFVIVRCADCQVKTWLFEPIEPLFRSRDVARPEQHWEIN